MSRLREDHEVQARVAQVARDSYGRLLAVLAAPTRDIAAAEDALADALERALARWPDDGIPANPEGWLLTVARNRLRDVWKSSGYRMTESLDEIAYSSTSLEDDIPAIPDRRLELMLVCAHPAIAPSIRTPLMLQSVLGVEAAAIATAFAVEPSTMAQRLVRAKKRIRDAGIPFVLPERDDLAERLPAVLEAVYGAYAIDWQLAPRGATIESLSAEALHLALVLAELLPATSQRCSAWPRWCACRRRAGRQGAPPTAASSRSTSRTPGCGTRLLIAARRGAAAPRPWPSTAGRFQYEAAIQSVHCTRATQGKVDVNALRKLHRALLRVAPSLGAAVASAAVDGEIDGPDAGLRTLDAIGDPAVERFQPAWTTRAHLLAEAGRVAEAADAYRRAIELTADPGVAEYLLRCLRSTTC